MLAEYPPSEIIGFLQHRVRAFQQRDLILEPVIRLRIGDFLHIAGFIQGVKFLHIVRKLLQQHIHHAQLLQKLSSVPSSTAAPICSLLPFLPLYQSIQRLPMFRTNGL